MIENTNRKNVYEGNGLNDLWPFTFEISTTDGSDVAVYITDDTGKTSERLTSGYTVDVLNKRVRYPDPAGTILPEKWKITLARETPLTQTTSLTTQNFDPKSVEVALDKLTMAMQEAREIIDRALVADITTPSGTRYSLPAPEPRKALGWNEDGTGVANYDNPAVAAAQAQAAADAAEQAKQKAAELENQAADWAAQAAQTSLGHIVSMRVASGETVSFGNVVKMLDTEIAKATNAITGIPEILEADNPSYWSGCYIDNQRILVTYRKNNTNGIAIILSITGTKITVGTPMMFASNASHISTCKLDEEHFLVAYRDHNNSYYGTAVVLTVSGLEIISGVPVVFSLESTESISICALDSVHALVAYYTDGTSAKNVTILTVVGTTITVGSSTTFETGNDAATLIRICVFDNNRALVTFRNATTYQGRAVVLTVSDSTVISGTPKNIANIDNAFLNSCPLDKARVLVTYREQSPNYNCVAVVLTISDMTVSVGAPTTILTYSSGLPYCGVPQLFDNSRVLVTTRIGTGVFDTMVRMLNISGNEISLGNSITNFKTRGNADVVCVINGGRAVLLYSDSNNDLAAVVLDILRPVLGISLETRTAGESCKIAVGPVITGLSELIPGAVYYLDDLGALTTTLTSRQIGIALSETELLWQPV